MTRRCTWDGCCARLLRVLGVWMAMAAGGFAQPVSMLGETGLLPPGLPMAMTRDSRADGGGPSLFAGQAAGSLFAPRPSRALAGRVSGMLVAGAPVATVVGLRDLIAEAEAGAGGYDAVQHGARIAPPRRPTALTLEEIEAWIAATPGQPHAIGRYQFIPATLRRLVADLGLAPGTRFSPALQDRLADLLLEEAGLSAHLAGRLSRRTFMHNLARIWAGLPTANGKSHYHGVAGNRATMTWSRFERGMARIFPG